MFATPLAAFYNPIFIPSWNRWTNLPFHKLFRLDWQTGWVPTVRSKWQRHCVRRVGPAMSLNY